MPFKHHAEHRHHIPKPRYRVTNWPAYNAALRRRSSLTVWFTDEAIAAWRAEPRTTPGGQPHYSALAIMTALTLRTVFGLALRQTEGLIGSVIDRLGLALAVPDYSTLSRRSQTLDVLSRRRLGTGPLHLLVDSTGLRLGGAGEWLVEKDGTSRRRSWRKLPIGIAIDASYLPGDFHADPMDRLIVATARHRGIPIVTSDRKIIAYAEAGYVNVIPC